MHIERLRQIKPTMQITKPRKASHLKTNAKREMQNLGELADWLVIILLEVTWPLNLYLCCHRAHERDLVLE